MDKKKDFPEIKPFLKAVRKEFAPEKIILFGSKARGDDWKQSDYDFIIVSKKFAGMHWLRRIAKIVRFWKLLTDIDVLPYTPAEFQRKKKESSIVRAAIKTGIPLAA
ncbi:MAG TPA: nucleotidyltransferase domain-containing protein [Candidatus Nanoarchaeia archaeon]|nr:nucleotidyltransferase domain-containing protein [Candidatus Nanoarchaeia archaeon]